MLGAEPSLHSSTAGPSAWGLEPFSHHLSCGPGGNNSWPSTFVNSCQAATGGNCMAIGSCMSLGTCRLLGIAFELVMTGREVVLFGQPSIRAAKGKKEAIRRMV